MKPSPSALLRALHLTLFGALALIVVGSTVRAMGAGLGCPDWPRCFGLWIPPISATQLPPGFSPELFDPFHTWTEYLNRLLGVFFGFLILAALLYAVRHARTHNTRPLRWVAVAFVLTGVQGFLGGMVVRGGLDEQLVSIHLIVAFIIVAVLLQARRALTQPTSGRALPVATMWSRLCSIFLALWCFQGFLGATVRGVVDTAAKTMPDAVRSTWLPQVWWPDHAHRQFGVLVWALGLSLLVIACRRRRQVRLVTIAFILINLQVALGLVLTYGNLPPAAQVLHVFAAGLSFVAVFSLWQQRHLQDGDESASPTIAGSVSPHLPAT